MSLAGRRLVYTVGSATLVDDVSVDLHPGELLAVLGPNGAGKSTLLRLLSRELSPTWGSVELDARRLADYPSAERARRIAVLPQTSNLAFPFRALEVVLLGRLPHEGFTSPRRDREIALAAMELAEVDHLAGRVYTTLSGGERQRVHLARVLAQLWEEQPWQRYLLLDEPTSALDIGHQQSLLQLARRLVAHGLGLLAVLHDLNLAAAYADRILLLNRGKIAAEGAPDEVLTADNVATVYGIRATIRPHPQHSRPMVIPLCANPLFCPDSLAIQTNGNTADLLFNTEKNP